MNWKQMKADIVAWEEKMAKGYPVKIILAICLLVILWQLNSTRKELRTTKRELWNVSWQVDNIESTVSDIESTVDNVESTVRYIKVNMN